MDGPELQVGSVLQVPDHLRRFKAPSREWHPGACVAIHRPELRATMLKGTGVDEVKERRRQRLRCAIVEPSESNGLWKPTVFDLDPRRLKLRPLELLARKHTLGILDEEDLRRLVRWSIGR